MWIASPWDEARHPICFNRFAREDGTWRTADPDRTPFVPDGTEPAGGCWSIASDDSPSDDSPNDQMPNATGDLLSPCPDYKGIGAVLC